MVWITLAISCVTNPHFALHRRTLFLCQKKQGAVCVHPTANEMSRYRKLECHELSVLKSEGILCQIQLFENDAIEVQEAKNTIYIWGKI